MATPFFPAWSNRLHPMGERTAPALRRLRSLTLCQLEACFAGWIPSRLFPKAATGQNSRDRDYTCRLTFWSMLWQALHPLSSGREVVRQLQVLFALENRRTLSGKDGAYCRAKSRLGLAELARALKLTSQAADQLASSGAELQGRPIKVADGSTVTLSDTRPNRSFYPPVTCGPFPMMRFVALFSLLSGSVLAVAQSAWGISELALLRALSSQLASGDILLGDRGFGSYPVVAWLRDFLKVDFIGRTTRGIDGRQRIRRLGPGDWLIRWQKSPHPSPWLEPAQWQVLPPEMILRAISLSCQQKGFRVRKITVITTLLDPNLYPASQIMAAHLQRWRMEMCLDDLKTTLQMECLRARSPEMAQREMLARLIAHNLVRCTMAQAAASQKVPLARLSFKGTLDAVRHFAQALARLRGKIERQRLWQTLLSTIAQDQIPTRPNRREPRAVKRKKNKYPRLTGPRRTFQDHPKRTLRAKNARLRRLGLM